MKDARTCMGELLTTLKKKTRDDEHSTKNSILIILDDVIDPTDIEWFQFRRGGVEEGDQINDLLITSRTSEFENNDVQVYLAPPLEIEEAVSILLTEADLSVDNPLANCSAVMDLVRECLLHPLLIKFAGRWICLRRVTSGGREEYECIIDEIRDVIRTSSSGNGGTTVNALLFKMMDHALSPRVGGNKTSIFRLCFVALVIVFYKDNCTTMISKEVVRDFFKEVIEMERDALANDHFYRKNGKRSVLEILGALSIVNFTKHSPTKGSAISEITVQIDHDLIRQFSQQILDDNSMLYFGKREDVEIRWNEAYIKSYSGQDSNYLWDDVSIPDRSRRYALENFPAHMIRAEMLDELEIILQNEGFIRARFRTLGWTEATRAHVSDSEAFAYVNNQTLVVIFNKVEAVLMSEVTGKSCPKRQCNALEAGRCLHEISLSLARLKIWDEAYRLCDLSVQLVQNELDPPELVASLLYNLSVICMKVKKFDEAETSIANCLKMAVKTSSIDNVLYVGALCQLGDILQRTESYKKAEAAYNDALQIVQALEGDQSPLLIQIFIRMADLLVSTSNFDDAVGYYTQCLEMQERLLGKEHEDIASIMYSMGLAMLEKGSFVVALDYFSISLDMRVHLYGENHQIIADTYDIMGFVEAKSGDFDASLQLLSNSLELRKSIGDKLREADTLVNIGNLFRERKDYEHALHQYNKCLMMRITALGRNHTSVAEVLMAIGNVHGDMNNISDALDRYREAVEIFASVNGPVDASVGLTFQKVGMLQVRAGNLESGRLFLEQAVDIYRQLGQEYESNLVIPLFVIGNIHKMMEETNEVRYQ
jgi:tetratricopeptide (TPR) repeat protein